ncbi:Transposon Tn7 transposition protein TnsC [Marinomonas aquimarina]|uniref:Transposon Tn7 transposition protein TnsC n=1 Tax=Marinomonas aquimarina TaxID=295068 RepID=A0A1A8T797_9GAMM|nr:TniB family NTP-binding protein [Marinomonas aquimarina]SBS28403.1 Transposon Tn7 transposition protein TnsC [Marinomonas aquimarina]
MTIIKARYRDDIQFELAKNPLIAALPDRVDSNRLSELLTRIIKSQDRDTLNQNELEMEIKKLKHSFIITDDHKAFYTEFYKMIEEGYLHRNPMDVEVVKFSYDIADPNIDVSELSLYKSASLNTDTTSEAMLVTGFSGNGKSLMTERITSICFPQVIDHDIEGFQDAQVVFLKADMPHNASRSGLIIAILEELDRAMSKSKYGPTNHSEALKGSRKSITVERMTQKLIAALNQHHVGVLIIDEFQNLEVSSARFRSEMINLFDQLSNQLKIPVVKIGTPDTIKLFGNKSYNRRRLGKLMELQTLGDDAWDKAMEQIFLFQPLPKPIERKESLENDLKDYTAGVPAYLFKLWQECLLEVIQSGKKSISTTLIKRVHKKQFPLLGSAIKFIKSGKAGNFSDLLTVQQFLDEGSYGPAINSLKHFVDHSTLKGEAAQEVKSDIEKAINENKLSPSQKKKFRGLKESLESKRLVKLGPQTIEHEGS